MTTLDDFEKEKKPDIIYVLCEHLERKSMTEVMDNEWIGEHKRLLLCPICVSVRVGDYLKRQEAFFERMDYFSGIHDQHKDEIERLEDG